MLSIKKSNLLFTLVFYLVLVLVIIIDAIEERNENKTLVESTHLSEEGDKEDEIIENVIDSIVKRKEEAEKTKNGGKEKHTPEEVMRLGNDEDETPSRLIMRQNNGTENGTTDGRQGICQKPEKVDKTIHTEKMEKYAKINQMYHNKTEKMCFNKNYGGMRMWFVTPSQPYYETKIEKEIAEECCPGFTLNEGRPNDGEGRLLCSPICDETCVKAYCATPNNCTCLKGYVKESGSKSRCKPHCTDDCGGPDRGECVSPETCLCKQGYIYKNDTLNTCVSDCPRPCENSVCVGPSVCKCNEGYKRRNRFKCIPDCKPECRHGDCVSPNECVCHKGYHNVNGTCLWECDLDCGKNGTCVGDKSTKKCTCDPGYKVDEKIKACTPVCADCNVSGICLKPNQCKCFSGYVPNGKGGCRFLCNFECGLGRCVDKDVCLCLRGYRFKKTAKGPKCVPICENCELGECIMPNKCQCKKGYVYVVPKEGHDKRIRCVKIKPKHKYYDAKICKSLYDEIKRKNDLKTRGDKTRIAKLKWEENRLKKMSDCEKKECKEKKAQFKYMKDKAQRRIDKSGWIKKQKIRLKLEPLEKERLERERYGYKEYDEDQRIKKMYADYKQNFKTEPSVTWKNLARVAVASLFLGPFGIIFW